jgi:hypothetical protein
LVGYPTGYWLFSVSGIRPAVFLIRLHMDPHSIGLLDPIQIRIRNADLDPGGLKRAKMKKKKPAKRQIIRHKKYRNQCNWYKNVYCDFSFIKI